VIRCSERFRTVTTLAGAFVLAAGAVFIGGAGLAACGDNAPKAITIGVDIGPDASGEACVEVDADAIREVKCDGGGQ
jgi:hypothetical protein